MGFSGRLVKGGGRDNKDEHKDCGGGLGGMLLPVVFLCWGHDGLHSGCSTDEVFCAGAWAATEGVAEARTGGGGAWVAGTKCSGLLREAGQGAR